MVWMVSVGVFDFDELDILHFGIFPLESDAPRRFAGVGVDGVFGSAQELVIVECRDETENFFIGLVKNGESLEGFDGIVPSLLISRLLIPSPRKSFLVRVSAKLRITFQETH
jgi:hypothetical protein